MTLFSKLRTIIKAYYVAYFRTRYVVKVFKQAHAVELRDAQPAHWPVILQRQAGELQAVRAGQLDVTALQGNTERRSWQWPFLPASVNRLAMPLLKPTPYNLRRMARTPIPHRAINVIKGAITAQPWDVVPMEDVPVDDTDDQAARAQIAKRMFRHPNGVDSWQTFIEQGLEDYLTFGALCAELGTTVDPAYPLKMWPVNVESIRLYASWTEATRDAMPHYVQMTGLKGERGAVPFYDDEMLYIKDNPATDTPFGLGKMEIAFSSVNAFLGVQEMSGKAGADQVHKTFLWWEHPQSEAAYQIVRRYIQNDLEGQAKLSLIGGMKKPEVVEVTPVTEEDLLLNWQEFLIRMIAAAFDMSAMSLGVERDVNRSTGEVLDDKDFRSAVVPTAHRLAGGLTRKVLHEKLGWYDLEFRFTNIEDPDAQTKMEIAQRQWTTNSITPNLIRKQMGQPPLPTPFADLTLIEHQIVLASIQTKAQAKQQEMMGPMGGPGAGGGFGGARPGARPGGGLVAPIAGARARAVAMMPVNQMSDVLRMWGMTAAQFAKELDTEDPALLDELADETREYLLHQIAKEKKQDTTKVMPKTLKRVEKRLLKVRKEEDSRPKEFLTYLGRDRNIGVPGKLNNDKGYKGKTPV